MFTAGARTKVGPFRLVRPSLVECLFGAVGMGLMLQYRWILDDSCIYYRYVDNLLFLHRGLVFNQGEFVEGYSSPAWLAVLVVLRATHLDFWSITLGVGVLALAGFWYAAVVTNRRLLGAAEGAPSLNFPLVYLFTAYCTTSYFTSGSESPLVQLAAACAALYCLDPSSRWLQVVLGALPLVRNELTVPFVAACAIGWHATRRVPWRLILSGGVLGSGWMLFRLYYYADPFPTPFYLKDKVSPLAGLYYVVNAFGPTHFLFAAAPLGILLVRLVRKRAPDLRLNERARMWGMAAASLPYVVKVGGDMMHYRLLAFPFCLLALSAGGLLERAFEAIGVLRRKGLGEALCGGAGLVFFAWYPWFLSSHPIGRHERRVLDHGISDAPWHRYHPALTFDAPRWAEDRARRLAYRSAAGQQLDVATDVFCAGMYNDFPERYVHGYGLTDPVLARVAVPEQRPGHKEDLVRLARDLVKLRARFPETKARNTEKAIASGMAPAWVVANRGPIEQIERRMYNGHVFFENVAGALRRVPAIVLEEQGR